MRGSAGGKVRAIQQKQEALDNYLNRPNICKECGSTIFPKTNQKISEVRAKKFCNQSCAGKHNNRNRIRAIKTVIKIPKRKFDEARTKQQLIIERGYFRARAAICTHAKVNYKKSNKIRHCFICGYSLHIHVAHIISVADFDGSATIAEINHIDNLVALCPNHHWEYDHNLLVL